MRTRENSSMGMRLERIHGIKSSTSLANPSPALRLQTVFNAHLPDLPLKKPAHYLVIFESYVAASAKTAQLTDSFERST